MNNPIVIHNFQDRKYTLGKTEYAESSQIVIEYGSQNNEISTLNVNDLRGRECNATIPGPWELGAGSAKHLAW